MREIIPSRIQGTAIAASIEPHFFEPSDHSKLAAPDMASLDGHNCATQQHSEDATMTILNMTQHTATEEQRAAGVIDLPGTARQQLVALLTVNELPSADEITRRCEDIAALAAAYASGDDRPEGGALVTRAMIGGAPWMMSTLERALRDQGITPCYAFSRRESVETTLPDGTVQKTAIFRHQGFVEP